MIGDLDWIHWLIGAFGGAIGLGLLGWALLRDRSRGRRRCPRCWYDLQGIEGLHCPECGHAARRPRHLLRTRRRWRWATVGAAGCLGAAALAASPKMKRDGWLSLVPTTVLLLAAPPAGQEYEIDFSTYTATEHPVSRELRRRDAVHHLWGWQWKLLIECGGVIRGRERWPAEVPLAIGMHVPSWLGTTEITARADQTELSTVQAGTVFETHCGIGEDARLQKESCQVLGMVKAGQTPRLHCRASQRVRDSSKVLRLVPRLEDIWVGTVQLPVKIVPTLDQAIEPAREAGLDALMSEALSITTHPCRTGWSWQTQISIAFDRSADAVLGEIAFGFVVEVMRDEWIIARAEVPLEHYRPFPPPTPQEQVSYGTAGVEIPGWPPTDDKERWSVRIRGDARAALTDWKRLRYWAGELILPIDRVLF